MMISSRIQFSMVLCLGFVMAGCPSGGDEELRELGEADNVTNTDPVDEHDHDEGPHGGHILEFGDYHGEITHKDGIVTVYVLGGDAETAVPLEGASAVLNLKTGDETIEIALTASPQDGEAEGSSSRYVSAAGAVPESVKDVEEIEGSVVLKVGDKSMTAAIEHDHDDHDHDHGDDHDHDGDHHDHDHDDDDHKHDDEKKAE